MAIYGCLYWLGIMEENHDGGLNIEIYQKCEGLVGYMLFFTRRFPLNKEGYRSNHPRLDHFGIETQWFGYPPF